MRTLLRIANVFLLVGIIICCAGALAGLIVFLPFVAGGWALNLVGLLGYEEAARTAPTDSRLGDDVANTPRGPIPEGASPGRTWSPQSSPR
jgi:hypothetical protein